MFALFALAHAEDLYVSSNERGASILLNGVDTGFKTPATINGVKPGRTLVTVESGCSRGEAEVDVLAGLTTRASIVATEQLGTLALVPMPAGARLELDGGPYQGSPGVPLAVSCGEHTVRASLDGYVTAVVTVEVGMGQDLTVPLTLQKLGLGTLELSVSPRSATIYLDGKPVGSDAVTLPSVYQGVHTISAELDGYQAAKKQVVVEDGSAAAWHFELVRSSQKRLTSTVKRLDGETTAGNGAGAVEDVRAPEAADREAAAAAEREAQAEREAAEAREAEEQAAREAQEQADREAQEQADREAAEEREREAREREERRATSRGASQGSRATVEGPKKPVGKTVGGVALLAAGVGGGVYSALAYDSASQAYRAYTAKVDGAGPDKQRQRLADDYYDDNVAPRQTLFYASAVGTSLFLAGGVVVLVVDERLPTLVPAADGGMLLWSGRF